MLNCVSLLASSVDIPLILIGEICFGGTTYFAFFRIIWCIHQLFQILKNLMIFLLTPNPSALRHQMLLNKKSSDRNSIHMLLLSTSGIPVILRSLMYSSPYSPVHKNPLVDVVILDQLATLISFFILRFFVYSACVAIFTRSLLILFSSILHLLHPRTFVPFSPTFLTRCPFQLWNYPSASISISPEP